MKRSVAKRNTFYAALDSAELDRLDADENNQADAANVLEGLANEIIAYGALAKHLLSR